MGNVIRKPKALLGLLSSLAGWREPVVPKSRGQDKSLTAERGSWEASLCEVRNIGICQLQRSEVN